MVTPRVAENGNYYIMKDENGETIRTFRKTGWTRKEVLIYRLGYMRALRNTKRKIEQVI